MHPFVLAILHLRKEKRKAHKDVDLKFFFTELFITLNKCKFPEHLSKNLVLIMHKQKVWLKTETSLYLLKWEDI